MAKMETMKATKAPINNKLHSATEKAKPAFTSFKALAPSIVGMAKKKENSAATVREVPKIIAPIMVAPEREVPGIIAKAWKNPIMMIVEYLSSLKELILGVGRKRSTTINKIP